MTIRNVSQVLRGGISVGAAGFGPPGLTPAGWVRLRSLHCFSHFIEISSALRSIADTERSCTATACSNQCCAYQLYQVACCSQHPRLMWPVDAWLPMFTTVCAAA